MVVSKISGLQQEIDELLASAEIMRSNNAALRVEIARLASQYEKLLTQEMTWTEHFVREAVEAERERCAKIAEKLNSDKVASGEYEHGYWDACNEVAVAIRKECNDV